MVTKILFKVNKKNVEFTVRHNMPNTIGSSIEDAIEAFSNRDYLAKTPEGFVSYIKSKGFKATLIN